MASNIVSEERFIEINRPTYLHKCTKCGELKPNTEYSPSLNKRVSGSKGRAYFSECKICRRSYSALERVRKRKNQQSPKLRKKHRISSIYWSSISNAKHRGWEHNITRKYLNELFYVQKGLCYYTNKPMLKDITQSENNNDSVSIDRFDSSKGYIPGNIVLCRWIVNRMKNDIEFNKFLQIVSEINKNFKR